MVSSNNQPGMQLTESDFLTGPLLEEAKEATFRDQWVARQNKKLEDSQRKFKQKLQQSAPKPEGLGISMPEPGVGQGMQSIQGDVFEEDGKYYSTLEPNMPFDTFQQAADRYRQNVFVTTGKTVDDVVMGGEQTLADVRPDLISPLAPDVDAVASDTMAAPKNRARSIKQKSASNTPLSNEDLFFVAENLSLFIPRKKADGSFDEADHIRTPNWFKSWLTEETEIANEAAKQLGENVSGFDDFKDIGFGRGPITDQEILAVASRTIPKDQVKAFESGVKEQRKRKFQDQIQQSGVSSDSFNDYARGKVDLIVEDTIAPAGKMYRAPFDLAELQKKAAKLNLTAAETSELQKRFEALQASGDIDEKGHADPGSFIATTLGRSGVSFLPKHRTSLGPIMQRGIASQFEMARASQKNWNETTGQAARNLYDAEGFLNIPGDPDGKLGMWIYNTGQGMLRQFAGLVDLVSWDNVDKKKFLENIYKNYVVDRHGATPLLRQELDLIAAEANSQMTAEIIDGMKESLYQLGGILRGEPRATADALAGDPIEALANVVLVARLATSLSGLGIPAGKLSKFQRDAKDFLAKADAELTGIPTVARFVGAAAKAPVWLAEKVSDKYGPLARQFFTSPNRLELAVRTAKEQGEGIEADVARISKNIEKLVEEGMSQADATQSAMAGVSKKSADFYARTVLDNVGFSHGAKEGFLQTLDNPQEVLTAIVSNDAKALREALPESMLSDAGIQPAMRPEKMTDATSKKGAEYETILVDPKVLMKQFDDAFVQLEKLGRGDELKQLLDQVKRAYTLIGRRDLKFPLIRPGSNLVEGTSGVPQVFDQNAGISNRALLLAMLLESKGKPVPVSVLAGETSYFKGPLVGPPDIVNKIPVADRSRLKVYESSGQSKAGDMLDKLNRDEVADYALYIRRAQNLARKDPEVFAELKKAYLEKIGLTEEQFNQTRLGGVAASVDNMIEELIVRGTPRAPGATEAIPSLFGVKRPAEYLTEEGVPAVGPTGEAFDIDPTMSPRMKQTTKGFEKYGESIEDMESARIVEATKRKEEMLSDSDGAPLSPERVEVIERVKRGEPAFTQSQDADILKTVMDAKSSADVPTIQRALNQRARLAKDARNQMVSDIMRAELEIGDTIASGGEWPEGTVPLAFSGTAEAVGSALANSHGSRGAKVARTLEKPSPVTLKYLNVQDGAKVLVPNFVNDAFAKLEALDNISANPNFLQQGLKGIGMIKRTLTSRSVPTGLAGVSSNYLLRGMVTGRFNPTGLVLAADDVKLYLSDPSKLPPEKLEMLRTMDDQGVFTSTVISQETIDRGLARFPTEIIADFLEGKPIVGAAGRALNAYNKLLAKHERYYNMVDPVFKVDHVSYLAPQYIETSKRLSPGKYMDFDIDKDVSIRVFRNPDGTYRYGKIDGRVIPESEIRKYATMKALKSANDSYFNYMDVPGGVELGRKSGADVLAGNPVFTWGWKATQLPGIKRGLQHEITYGARGFNTNDPAIRADMNRRRLANQVLRTALMNAFAATSRDKDLKTPEGREIARRYMPSRQQSIKTAGGPIFSRVFTMDSLNPYQRSADVGNAALSLLVKNKEALLQPYIEQDINKIESYVVERVREDARRSLGKTKDKDLINQRAQQILSERLDADPSWIAKAALDMRRSHAMFQQDPLKAAATIFNLSEPLYKGLSKMGDDEDTTTLDDVVKNIVIPYGTSSATMKALLPLLPKISDGSISMDDVYGLLRVKKLPNRYINKTMDKFKKNQMAAYERERGLTSRGIFGRKKLTANERIDMAAKKLIAKYIQDLDQLAFEAEVFRGLDKEVKVKQPDFKGTGTPRLRVEDSLIEELITEEQE